MGPFIEPQYNRDMVFWESIFLQLVSNYDDPKDAAEHADAALALWRERWPQNPPEIREYPIYPMPAYADLTPKVPPALERLIEAQNKLDAARKMLEALKNLCLQMPEELGQAYYEVAAPDIVRQIDGCEEWVKNVQAEIERTPMPGTCTKCGWECSDIQSHACSGEKP